MYHVRPKLALFVVNDSIKVVYHKVVQPLFNTLNHFVRNINFSDWLVK